MFKLTALARTLSYYRVSSSVLLPRSETLRLHPFYYFLEHYPDDYRKSMDLIVQMTRSRCHLSDGHAKKASHLTFLGFSTRGPCGSPPCFSDTLKPLLALRDEGLIADIGSFYFGDPERFIMCR